MIPPGIRDRPSIEAWQLAAVRALAAALAGNRFYAEKWRGLEPPASLSDFTARYPLTTKVEIVEDQRAHPPFGTNLTYPLERYTRFSQTSGTTGVPLRWLDTTETWSWMVDNWVRVYTSSGVGTADRIFFAFGFGPFLGFWSAFEAGVRLGALCIPGGAMSSPARVRAILDNEVTAICCTPTYAIHLGEVAEAEGLDLSRASVRTLLVAGEPGASIPATRERLETLWPRARVRDHHGMTEVGPVTYECPERARVLHVMENAFIPEVIDPTTGAAVPAGEPGELVLTNLGRTGSPLIRYRTGDLVRTAAAPVCPCGSAELALEGGILGRVDDMVVVRGVNVYPSAVEDVLRRFQEVVEYRVEVRRERTLAEVRVEVETVPECASDPLCRSVEAALRSAFNLRVPVTAVCSGTLPRFEAKAKRWVYLGSESEGA
jgi:phenylacetate-CoA ligase